LALGSPTHCACRKGPAHADLSTNRPDQASKVQGLITPVGAAWRTTRGGWAFKPGWGGHQRSRIELKLVSGVSITAEISRSISHGKSAPQQQQETASQSRPVLVFEGVSATDVEVGVARRGGQRQCGVLGQEKLVLADFEGRDDHLAGPVGQHLPTHALAPQLGGGGAPQSQGKWAASHWPRGTAAIARTSPLRPTKAAGVKVIRDR